MTLELTIDQQNVLLNAYNQLDGYDSLSDGKKPVRVQYKLGGQRRVLVKNMTALKASLNVWQETSNSIFKESFPGVPEGQTVNAADDPEAFAKYREAITEAATKKDTIDLLPITEKAVYEDNEMPAGALTALNELGLIAA